MTSDTFTCALCRGVFEKGWTDEEAEQILKEEFPGVPKENCELVCSQCHDRLMAMSFE